MITHKKNKWVNAWFCRHASGLLRKNFRRCSLTRTTKMPVFEKGVPAMVISNHSSWWDAILALYLSHDVFKRDAYGVFDEEQLKRYAIFRYVGAYSVNRSRKREMPRFLDYSRKLLEGRERLLWIYPQGNLLSNELPLKFETGFSRIASRLSKVQLLKLTVSYDFWVEPQPEIVVDWMPLETIQPSRDRDYVRALTSRLRSEMQERMNEVRRIVRLREDSLKPVFIKEPGTHAVYDAYRRCKAWVKGERFRKSHGASVKATG